MSYDIIKAHNGEIKVENKVNAAGSGLYMEEEATTFTILLPVIYMDPVLFATLKNAKMPLPAF